MNIRGITNNDLAGASLISGNRLITATSEERFNNIKDFRGWPASSISYVLQAAKLELSEVDHVCYGWSAGFSAANHLELYLKRYVTAHERGPAEVSIFHERVHAEIEHDISSRSEFDRWARDAGMAAKVYYVDHHEAHAISSFALSPFSSGLAVSCDGRGDFSHSRSIE